MKQTSISVVVPCFGQARYVHDAISSVSSQTYKAWRCAVVFDEAESGAQIREATQNDDRFELVVTARVSTPTARNIGLRKLDGTYIVALDADDKLSPLFFERAAGILDLYNDVLLVYGQAALFGSARGMFDVPPFSHELLRTRNMIYSAAMFRRKAYECVDGYDELLEKGLEDWELWVALLKHGERAIQLQTIEFYYRQHQASKTACMNVQHWNEACEYIRRKHADFCAPSLQL
jgi:glycosyltransferase involved in cell wall biosynthesis